ncbi:hypothetical protein IMX12_13210 [Streptomyces sp. Babs14]|uniref:hypothetical protein n=1 Tax=unclassified Streptomyces TaxID=2593676 RepID=UPI001C235FC6|nr:MULTISPECIES: hypothetical protein [unclassified Streptomyces]MBU8549768.1 hypothetical protein [Streptomyces sp. Osf17]MBU8556551.1 hypothetical protein [Streptomyces sp. Babs14]
MTAQQPADQTTPLRDRIAETIWAQYPDAEPSRTGLVMANPHAVADAVLAVLPAPVDRAAVLRDFVRELGDRLLGCCQECNACAAIARDLAAEMAESDAELRRVADETATTETPARDCPACDAGIGHSEHCPTPETHKWGCGCQETHPPAAAGLPAGTLEAAEIGANRLDAWARSPQGRNFLAHALVQLARTGWLRTEPGDPFEPMRQETATAQPAARARQDGARP